MSDYLFLKYEGWGQIDPLPQKKPPSNSTALLGLIHGLTVVEAYSQVAEVCWSILQEISAFLHLVS